MREIRADYDDQSIVVYQAYSPHIADPAVAAQRFVPPFKMERMTWIKPSFLWMMYRCGYAQKEGQERVLAVRITRTGFDWAVSNAVESSIKGKPAVRVQWDPERGLRHEALQHRSIQIGLTREAVQKYVNEWTVSITDVTPLAREVHAAVRAGDDDAARALLPVERPYAVSER
ncbi:DUF4291 domain-containing protein [Lentzea aerocolonigenes]|uniref:DUF4291 domain-containing protein n=1 Tax=Lentzea aerocolonigenes TaxID=68170 RepID=UPI0004C2EE5E|nr:DUF4291 domain-containing protein [Lentzea aerocolonigenes]MCP2246230.1 protein of unknown function (DUF4291) [Lentzea aerocolonigenes]